MPTVTFIDNPNAPGAIAEMERLRRENADLKRRLNGGSANVEPELTQAQLDEQPRTFKSGLCTITIVPLSQMPPLMMNPDFGGITIRGNEALAQSRVGGKKVAKHVAEKTQKVGAPISHATVEEDDAALRFQLIEMDK